GYPDSKEFKTFFPTDVLETAGEIIFFWVSRMIMLSLYVTGKAPFKNVYLHGLVLDAKGKKMSKSKSNVINPLAIIDKFGTDAFRMALVVGNTPGTSLALAEDKIKAYRNFANKLWNISRFVLSQERAGEIKTDLKEEFDALARDVTQDMENFRFYLAAEKLYAYLWHTFADKIIEESKGKPEYSASLYYILENSLKLLHPFMPFITEEIWQELRPGESLLMVEAWPKL
ncbi:MAG: class I tRNA ligase family protein, partial [bacterium]|nr:class I tRNA ligase family protein [bacterium]